MCNNDGASLLFRRRNDRVDVVLSVLKSRVPGKKWKYVPLLVEVCHTVHESLPGLVIIYLFVTY